MPGPQQTRQIGSACRIYKNATDNVIAIDKIAVVERVRTTKDFKRIRTGFKTVQRTLFHFGGDRVVASILSIGDYTSLSANKNEATWVGTDDSSDVEVTFSDLPQIGATV